MDDSIPASINVADLKESIQKEVACRHQTGGFDSTRNLYWVRVKALVLMHTIEAYLQPREVSTKRFNQLFGQAINRLPNKASAISRRAVLKLNRIFDRNKSSYSLTHLLRLSLESQKLLLALVDEINTSNNNKMIELESRIKMLESITSSSQNIPPGS